MKVALKELGTIITGNTPSKRETRYWDSDDICFVKPDIISEDGITDLYRSNEHISEYARNKARIVTKDSLFVTCIGSIGKIGLVSADEMAFNQQINAIIPNEKILPRYLAYSLLRAQSRLQAIANAPVVPIINKTQFGDFLINYNPDKEKQSSIVKILDSVDNIIKIKKREMKAFDDLIKARFVEMFGDPIVNPKSWIKLQLQQLVSQDCSISYGIVQTGDDVENGIPVFRPVDIVGRIPNRAELKRTARQISERYKRTVLKGRELLITVRANIADTFIAGTEFTGCNVGRGIVPIRTDESKIRLEFLKALIDCEVINRHIKSLAKGITLIQLNMEDLRTIELIVPPVSLQDEYIRLYKEVDKSKVVVQKSLEQTKLLFDSLVQQYFG